MKAKAIIIPQEERTKKGNTVAIRIWKVPKNKEYPEGINYSFQLISEGKRVLGYDNNTCEGHHKHYIKNGKLIKEKEKFENWENTMKKFRKEVKEFEETQNETQEN